MHRSSCRRARRAAFLALTLPLLLAPPCATVAGAGLPGRVMGPPASSPARATPVTPASLREGLALYRAGDYARARVTLTMILPRASGLPIHDTLLYYAAQATDLAGDPTAAAPLFHALSSMHSPFAATARWREADCLHDAGDLASAARIYQRLLASHARGGDTAVALWNVADAAMAARDQRRAEEALRRLYVEDPAHPLAERVPARLLALDHRAPVWSTHDRIARARAFDEIHEWRSALAELALVPKGAPARERLAAELETATVHFHARDDYATSAHQFLDVWRHLAGEAAADALFHGARALSRVDRDDDAIRLYLEVVRRFPHSRSAAEAQYLAGWLDYNRGRWKAGLPALEREIARYRRSPFAHAARFCVGFSYYQLGEYEKALPYFEALARATRRRKLSEQGQYWQARALEQLGNEAPAIERYRRIVAADPFSWYALTARARLAAAHAPIGPFGDDVKVPASLPVAASLGPLDAAVEADTTIRRVDALLAAGLPGQASTELGGAERSLLRRFGPVRALPVLLDRFARAGDFHHPHDLAEIWAGADLRVPPTTPPLLAWWQAAYPRAYRALVEKFGPGGGNPPDYLYAIMRQESGFDPGEVSYADAIGLLQMIPPTSRRVGVVIGVPYTDDILYDPHGNIEFGAWYIGHLVLKFRNQIPLAAGSFNAGPRAMMRWCDEHGGSPMDEFVERVPYTQTRDYIERVTSNYARYVWLYRGEDYQLPLSVDPHYDTKDGIDY